MRFRRRRDGSGKFLTTVLFTDIAGSTELAAEVGDAAWEALLRRYYAMVRDRLGRFGGRQIDTAGDGLFAAFDAPGDAINCALSIRDGATALGLGVRSGLHMGEAQTIEGKVGGIAVHIGARIASEAAPGEVLVSATLKDLVAGSGLRFADRGDTVLKGVPGEWRLFQVIAPATDAPGAAPGATGGDRNADQSAGAVGRWLHGLSRTSTRGRVLVVALAAILLATIAGAAFVVLDSPGVAIDGDSVGRMDASGRLVAAARVGALPSGIAFSDDGSAWVTNTTGGTVSRLNASGTTVIQTIPVGASPTGIAFGGGAIWVADGGARTVARINPAANAVVATYTVGNAPTGIAWGFGAVWVTNRLDGTLARIDPTTGDVRTFPVGLTPAGVAVGAGSVWVADFDSGTVVRIDPSTGRAVSAPLHTGNGASAVAATDQAVWVANERDGTVSHIDPDGYNVVGAPSVGGDPTGIAIGPDAVWVAVSSAHQVVEINPSTNQEVGSWQFAVSPQAVATVRREPWFTARTAESTHAGGTLTVASTAAGRPESPDPSYVNGADFQKVTPLLLLTNDGLLAYMRVGGPDGQELVPDLATSLPDVSADGLTYRFQLRKGLTFSTGAPLRASDVRRSFERSGASGLVGTESCTQGAACDLSRGIEVDDATGTVTFHLAVADPYFLYNLAQPWSYIVPGDTPLAKSATPLPATGPYMFKRFDAGGIVLQRNPNFHEWSPAAQPAGYPDEIDWITDPDPVSLVQSGRADWVADDLTSAQIDSLKLNAPLQIHGSPGQPFIEWMNTTIKPFDNPLVRQAVNWATDRAKVAEAYGGGFVTCQVMVPNTAGYEPYCPYTDNPDAIGSWQAPDIARARSLISQSGIIPGEQHVTVWGCDCPGHRDVARYFADLLRQLGFSADTKLLPLDAIFGPTGTPSNPFSMPTAATVQMAGSYSVGSPPTAWSNVLGVFTCPDFPGFSGDSYGGYPSQYCDRALDRQVQAALQLDLAGDPASRATANAMWAEMDRSIVDAAPAVMPFNVPNAVFLSTRVGGFQPHPVWQILLDQLWVVP